MAEYIEKQAAIKAIKRAILDKYIAKDAIDAVCNIPSAQPEIVRCKECVHYDLAKNGYNGQCNRQYATFYADDFCSYGERRGDAE